MGVNTFVTSDTNGTGRKSKKRLIIGITVLVCIVGAVAVLGGTPAGRTLLAKLGIPISQNDSKHDKDTESQPSNMLNYKASQLLLSGDREAAVELYQKEIDRTSNKKDKAELLLEISNLLWNNGESPEPTRQQALDFAKQAEQLHPTAQSAALLRIIYLKIGNSTDAQKYLDLRNKRDPGDPNDYRSN